MKSIYIIKIVELGVAIYRYRTPFYNNIADHTKIDRKYRLQENSPAFFVYLHNIDGAIFCQIDTYYKI